MPVTAPWSYIVWALTVAWALLCIFVVAPLANLCLQSWYSGCGINFWDLLAMKLRRSDVQTIVYSRIRLAKLNIWVDIAELDARARAGVSLPKAVSTVIAAKHCGWKLPFAQACELDLAGIDGEEFVQRVRERGSFDDESSARVLADMTKARRPETR